jgi:hypothetical protein
VLGRGRIGLVMGLGWRLCEYRFPHLWGGGSWSASDPKLSDLGLEPFYNPRSSHRSCWRSANWDVWGSAW